MERSATVDWSERASVIPPRRRRVQWRRAWRAARELMDDPEQTEKAFEVSCALDGGFNESPFRAFLEHPEGRDEILPSSLDRWS